MHAFASETINNTLDDAREWVNVEIDHHGIAPGKRLHGLLPLSGLTIRIRFDEEPEACWWYVEETENGRRVRPPVGSPQYLDVVAGQVEYTFPQKCQPRENYGLSLVWR
jgi:hypothetical protein